MHKYILTERNIHDMAGRIRKFFNSCEKCGMLDYTTSRKNIKGKNSWDGSYFSRPSGENVCVGEFQGEPVLHIELPVRTDITIGSAIYFLGGNKIMVRDHYQRHHHDDNGKTYFSNHLSKFVDVYERNIRRRYMVSSK